MYIPIDRIIAHIYDLVPRTNWVRIFGFTMDIHRHSKRYIYIVCRKIYTES